VVLAESFRGKKGLERALRLSGHFETGRGTALSVEDKFNKKGRKRQLRCKETAKVLQSPNGKHSVKGSSRERVGVDRRTACDQTLLNGKNQIGKEVVTFTTPRSWNGVGLWFLVRGEVKFGLFRGSCKGANE